LGQGILAFLNALAQDERERIVKRAQDGGKAVKVRGVQFGRKPKLTQHQQAEGPPAPGERRVRWVDRPGLQLSSRHRSAPAGGLRSTFASRAISSTAPVISLTVASE
jgi:hypothetical protein